MGLTVKYPRGLGAPANHRRARCDLALALALPLPGRLIDADRSAVMQHVRPPRLTDRVLLAGALYEFVAKQGKDAALVEERAGVAVPVHAS